MGPKMTYAISAECILHRYVNILELYFLAFNMLFMKDIDANRQHTIGYKCARLLYSQGSVERSNRQYLSVP